MSSPTRFLYIISFFVKKESGLAMVAASNEREAINLLQNSGKYSRSRVKYEIEQTKNMGELCSCEFGVIMESYTNAMVAYAALVSVLDDIKGPKGDKGDKGDPGKDAVVTAEDVEEALGYTPGKVSVDTKSGWDAATGYIPEKGEIIVYKDRELMTIDGHLVYVPGIKIGSGNGYVQDLAFTDSKLSDTVMSHISDGSLHVTAEEKSFWSNKINVNDNEETVGEILILNRN